MFKAFDRDNDGYVNMEEWVRGLSVFLRGTVDEHLKCTSLFLLPVIDMVEFLCHCLGYVLYIAIFNYRSMSSRSAMSAVMI